MDETSVTADKIIISGSQSGIVPAIVVLSTDGKTVCISPATKFAYGETVNVTVKDGLKTLTGQVLTGTSYSFGIRNEMTPEAKQQLEEYLATHDDGGYPLNEPRSLFMYLMTILLTATIPLSSSTFTLTILHLLHRVNCSSTETVAHRLLPLQV